MANRTDHKKMYRHMSEDYRMLLAQHQEMRREIKALTYVCLGRVWLGYLVFCYPPMVSR